jgi:hypothetical protein
MNTRRSLAVAVVWFASLVGVAVWAQRSGDDQTVKPAPNLKSGQPIGAIISGENIGFQPLAGPPDREGRISGILMVRVNGEWVETTSPIRIVRSK